MSFSDPIEIVLTFDSRVYRLEAVKKAAYRYGNRCSAEIRQLTDDAVEVTLRHSTETDSQQLAGDFRNEVLDQELREVIAQETTPIRNLLLAQAFSMTNLVDQVGEAAAYEEDPLGISRPDRE